MERVGGLGNCDRFSTFSEKIRCYDINSTFCDTYSTKCTLFLLMLRNLGWCFGDLCMKLA